MGDRTRRVRKEAQIQNERGFFQTGDEHFPEALQLVREQRLYAEALRLYEGDGPHCKVLNKHARLCPRESESKPAPSPPAGSQLCLRRTPRGATPGGAGGPVAMAMRGVARRPAGVCEQLQLEERRMRGPADPPPARTLGAAGQRPGRYPWKRLPAR